MSIRRSIHVLYTLLGLLLVLGIPAALLAEPEALSDSTDTVLSEDLQADPASFDASAAAAAAASDFPDSYGLLVRTGLSLLVVLIIIWAAVQIMRRFSGGSSTNPRDAHIKVLDRTFLGPKKAVYVIRIGSRALAVGVTDNQVSPLADLDLEETLAAYPDASGRSASQTFSTVFQNVRSRFTGDTAREAS